MTSHTTVVGDNSCPEKIQQEPAGEGDLLHPLGEEQIKAERLSFLMNL